MIFNLLRLCSIGLILSALASNSHSDYERVSSQIDHIYLFEHGTDQWGIRIVLTTPGPDCSEWYLKMGSDLSDHMYSLALSAEAQNKTITLMRRSASENLEGTTICGVHRIYSKEIP